MCKNELKYSTSRSFLSFIFHLSIMPFNDTVTFMQHNINPDMMEVIVNRELLISMFPEKDVQLSLI